ncbi:hypothetical protein KBX06_21595 [Micromonospora sp. C31]|uniref:hypothetical protein n=1 Tax=Micromonospora sp. C31 TaxID=2824876 RepID=UPI001B3978A6|nr:hypothetical protein [Micromonospora sp. C31]MBQ1075731.1 hypothetical protein [Micromonospora sp. C31]
MKDRGSGAAGAGRPAAARAYADPEAVDELRSGLRLTPAHPDCRADRLTDRCPGLSGREATASRAALAAHPVLRRLGLPRLLAAASGNPLALGGVVLVLVGPPAMDDATQVESGRCDRRSDVGEAVPIGRHHVTTGPDLGLGVPD